MFVGHQRFLPAALRRVIGTYFNNWNALKDIADYPRLIEDLGAVKADRQFPDTDWEALHAFYKRHMERYSILLSGRSLAGEAHFTLRCPAGEAAKPLAGILGQYCQADGALKDNFDIWLVDKLLRRAGAQLKSDRGFVAALKQFGAASVSLEESLSFYRQIQAYHSEHFLRPELKVILDRYLDSLHTMTQPSQLPELVAELQRAGASIRVHPSVEAVLSQHTELARLAAEDPPAGSAAVAAVLEGQLRTQLYPFQREGVAFLVGTRRALLADDMGLGKTLQAIAAALYLQRQQGLKRALVVCPASLKYQWQSEVLRFTGRRAEVIGGDQAAREQIYRAAQLAGRSGDAMFVDSADMPFFYIINYELVYRDIEALKQLGCDLLILDEAQRVKNFRTKTAQAVFELPAPFVFVLTGTPLENQLMELFTIMKFIDSRALGKNPIAFRDRYVVLDRFGGIAGYQKVPEVARKIAAITLRRTKKQALSQLPPLVVQDRWLELTDTQRSIYKELQGQARETLSQQVWDSVEANNAMVLLQRLREVCDTPELIDPAHSESQKLSELKELLEDEIGALDRQVIIFTQWTRMGEIILRELKQAGYSCVFLHGGVSAKERAALVQRFNEGGARVFISTDAGGLGLNLQAASLVVNFDLPFNPAKVAQRMSRAHRMGQEETVFAVNLLCRSTVEERLMGVLREKQALFDDVFGDISDPDQPHAFQQLSLREMLKLLV
jgi:SNF2 family DNA or RNA helicase